MDSRMIVPGCPIGPISYYAHDGSILCFLNLLLLDIWITSLSDFIIILNKFNCTSFLDHCNWFFYCPFKSLAFIILFFFWKCI